MYGWIERQLTSKSNSLMKLASITLILSHCLFGPAFAKSADDGKLHIIVFCALPDDCEIDAEGTAAMWAAQEHHVKFASTTNGDIGHATMTDGPLLCSRLKIELRSRRRYGVLLI